MLYKQKLLLTNIFDFQLIFILTTQYIYFNIGNRTPRKRIKRENLSQETGVYIIDLTYSAVQTPGFSPPAPAPAKKTPAPGKKLRLRQKTCEN